MRYVIGWSVFIGLVWFGVLIGVQALSVMYPEMRELAGLTLTVQNIGAGLGRFISPVLQLALVLFIFLEVAKRMGIQFPERLGLQGFRDFSSMNNVQALIAILIVGAVCLAALGGVGRVDVLKDLALVVVGFYFGSRRRPADDEAGTSSPAVGSAAPDAELAGITTGLVEDTPPSPQSRGLRAPKRRIRTPSD